MRTPSSKAEPIGWPRYWLCFMIALYRTVVTQKLENKLDQIPGFLTRESGSSQSSQEGNERSLKQRTQATFSTLNSLYIRTPCFWFILDVLELCPSQASLHLPTSSRNSTSTGIQDFQSLLFPRPQRQPMMSLLKDSSR